MKDAKEYSKEEKEGFHQKYFEKHRHKVYKKISKSVIWKGLQFSSIKEAARHIGYQSPSTVSIAIKNKQNLRGDVPRFGKLESCNVN